MINLTANQISNENDIQFSVDELQGFDPLSEGAALRPQDRSIFEEATQRVVQNILKSYTGYFDIFAELIQNSLDALEKKASTNKGFKPRLWIYIDIAHRKIKIIDNGCGLTPEEVKFCFRPNVSFKDRKKSRGHKGVGATFLAYGFGLIRMQTKKDDDLISVQLTGGRHWADDQTNSYPRPKLELEEFDVPQLRDDASGTCIEISIAPGQRPDLGWWGATTAEQWYQILRMRTPLGGIYLTGTEAPKINVTIAVTDFANTSTEKQYDFVEYFYPHEMSQVLPKVRSLEEIKVAVSGLEGDNSKIPQDFKMLDAMYEVWRAEDILEEHSVFSGQHFDPSEEELIRKHNVSVYGCFFSSSKRWGEFQKDVLKIRPNPLISKGGYLIASDYMVQGDLNVIPLTSTIGYQANTQVVIHFHDGNPDMGRKVFQPEIRALAESLSRQVVNIFKKYLYLMREDTGSANNADDTEAYNWLEEKKLYRSKHPLEFSLNDRKMAFAAIPRSEQDVISVFHELVGMEAIKGIRFLCTSELDRYDSCYVNFYDKAHAYSQLEPLGISSRIITGKESRPFILEYKFDLDGLVADYAKEVKFQNHINTIICWQIGNSYSENFSVRSYLVGEEGSNRQFYGATHSLWHERIKLADIVCVQDLIRFYQDKNGVLSEHATRFKF